MRQSATKAGTFKMQLVLDSDAIEVRRALSTVTCHMQAFHFSQDCIAKLELVVAEVLNNIVEHAYSNGSDGKIRLSMWQTDDGINCEVCDCGQQMPGLQLPDGTLRSIACDTADLPEGGFGWFLIRQMTSRLTYMRKNSRNYVLFCVSLS